MDIVKWLSDHEIESTMTSAEKSWLITAAGLAGPGSRALEIGTAYGGTAILLALAGMEVDTCDNWVSGVRDRFLANLALVPERARSRVHHYDRRSPDFIIENTKPYDYQIVLIDGSHQGDAPFNDAMHAMSRVRRGGFLLMDDVANGYPDVTESALRAATTLGLDGFRFVTSLRDLSAPCHSLTKLAVWWRP